MNKINFRIDFVVLTLVSLFYISCKSNSFLYVGYEYDTNPPNVDSVFEATFIGGKDSLNSFLKRNLKFNLNYKTNGVIVWLSSDSLGNTKNPEVKKRLVYCDSCNTEALRVAALIKKVNPSFQIKNGTKTTLNSEFKIMVSF